jgi:superfamily I DNA/RNA helicase
MKKNVKIALSNTFFDALSGLPQKIKDRTIQTIQKFSKDPTASGLNYETIRNSSSPNMRSIRITQDYRAIVYKPDQGNLYMILWVDKHDRAYAWATRARCKVNPEVGSVQLWFNDHIGLVTQHTENKQMEESPLFGQLADRKLAQLGLPDELLPSIRRITSIEELNQLSSSLPNEVYEALYWISTGETFEDVVHAMKPTADHQVNTEDFETALTHEESKRSFIVVTDDNELDALLNAPLEKWRVFLHPIQRKIVEKNWNGPVRVLGGAGTGKTVAAMHRAKWLVNNFYIGLRKKILFTTFTKNLALDIEQNLEKICTEKELQAIEVTNLDRWVTDFLTSQRYQYKIYYPQIEDPYWEEAIQVIPSDLDYPLSFYREEWEEVILCHGITEKEEYLRTSRAGRNKPLSRRNRVAVWEVFEEYRRILASHNLKAREDAFRDARLLIKQNPNLLPYESIIVDEAQDMGNEAFKLIHQIISHHNAVNSLFITGDAHQRIYNRSTVLGRCGIDIRGRGRKLKLNYRTTEENRRCAVGILNNLDFDDLDGHQDNQKGYISLMHGQDPEVHCFGTLEEEIEYISQILSQIRKDHLEQSICIVARTKKQVEDYSSLLKMKGISTYIISDQKKESFAEKGVRIATMHRVKGLEFDYVFLAGVNNGVIPYNGKENSDHTNYKQERSLLYVALTRAKKQVYMSCYGKPSIFLPKV